MYPWMCSWMCPWILCPWMVAASATPNPSEFLKCQGLARSPAHGLTLALTESFRDSKDSAHCWTVQKVHQLMIGIRLWKLSLPDVAVEMPAEYTAVVVVVVAG